MVLALTWLTALLLVPLSVVTIRSVLTVKQKKAVHLDKMAKSLSRDSVLLDRVREAITSSLVAYHRKASRLTTLEILALTLLCSLAVLLNLFSVTDGFQVGIVLYSIIGINILAVPFHFHQRYSKKEKKKRA